MGRLLEILRQRAAELPLATVPVRQTPKSNVQLGNVIYPFSVWDGEQLENDVIAIDCETAPILEHAVPPLALVSVSDGTSHCLIHPDRLAQFLASHETRHFVAHNAAFDFWVIDQHLQEAAESPARHIWWNIVDQARLHDTMLLDALIRLARSGGDPRRTRDLGIVAKEYAGIVIDKTDPFRVRYGEMIGQPWDAVETGFFQYAIKDAIATVLAFEQMTKTARQLLEKHRHELEPGTVCRFGLLSEALQVQGAVALAAIERNGLHLDLQQVDRVRKQIEQQIHEQTHILEEMDTANGLFKRSKDGELIWAPKSGTPRIDEERLRDALQTIVRSSELDIEVPCTEKTHRMTTSTKYWSQHADLHPFIRSWTTLNNLAKLHQFVGHLDESQIHPRYSPLVRTGRTSCSTPNIQQLPRSSGFREMVVPSPGHVLLAIDYAAIELRTLAAICEHRYGHSVLARIIRDRIDPHAYTAALFEGVSLDEFLGLRMSDNAQYRQRRQQAKALNFGIPGGLGAASLVDYAASSYGVVLTQDEAGAFRKKLIREVYPEMQQYLHEDSAALLAINLQCDAATLRTALAVTPAVRNVIRGQTCKEDGSPYNEAWIDKIWETLVTLNRNPNVRAQLQQRQGSDALHNRLFWGPVMTLTGRLRGRVSFSQVRNTPFQGLAADGAKRALWKLACAGYRCVAFIHDEILIELPVEADHDAEARRIDRMMCQAMQEFTGTVPIECEYALMERWYKQAEAVRDAEGKLVPWRPDEPVDRRQ